MSQSRVNLEQMARTERELALLFARISEVYAERATIMGKLTGTNMATGRRHQAPHLAALPAVSIADEARAAEALKARGNRRRA